MHFYHLPLSRWHCRSIHRLPEPGTSFTSATAESGEGAGSLPVLHTPSDNKVPGIALGVGRQDAICNSVEISRAGARMNAVGPLHSARQAPEAIRLTPMVQTRGEPLLYLLRNSLHSPATSGLRGHRQFRALQFGSIGDAPSAELYCQQTRWGRLELGSHWLCQLLPFLAPGLPHSRQPQAKTAFCFSEPLTMLCNRIIHFSGVAVIASICGYFVAPYKGEVKQ